MKASIVALLTDYGLRDTYVAELKGVLLGFRRDCVIIDVCHEITPYNILEGAFLLKVAAKSFPQDTVFIAVVDPTVGGARDAIAVFTRSGKAFIGPDNGLLYPAAEKEGITEILRIKTEKLSNVSPTFHGRDVFAYFVGNYISGRDIKDLVEQKNDMTRLSIPKPVWTHDVVEAVALHVDKFGNVITNIEGPLPESWHSVDIIVNGVRIQNVKKARTYADAGTGMPLLVVGGTGYTELAVNQGNAAEKYSIKPGKAMRILRNR